VGCKGENTSAPSQLSWHGGSAEILATLFHHHCPWDDVHSGIMPFLAVFLCFLRHLSPLLVLEAGRVHVTA